jgi:rare lipoprotein A
MMTRRTLGGIVLAFFAVVLIGPLTYDQQAHHAMDAFLHRWSAWGGPLLGLDVSAPRQNVFSLARDLDRRITIIDHHEERRAWLLGAGNFLMRGSLYTVADVLRWFAIPLTARQAHALDLCRPLDRIAEDEPIVIWPDPFQSGIASWYGPGFQGETSASGEPYNMFDDTAAHKTLQLGSMVRVFGRRTGNSTVVRINDRGPYVAGRIIDLSYKAKRLLGMEGVASVYLEKIDPTALDVDCK